MFNAKLNGSMQQKHALPPPPAEEVKPPAGGQLAIQNGGIYILFTPIPGHIQFSALNNDTQAVALGTPPPGGTQTSCDLAPEQLAFKHTSETFGTR